MVLRVQRIDGALHIVLPTEAAAQLGLREGSAVEIVSAEQTALAAQPVVRTASLGEALEAYELTEPLHRRAYRELAK